MVGTDGVQKMSKSLDNYIAVDEPPNDMYGKVMSIEDGLMANYFELLTDLPGESLSDLKRDLAAESVNPMEHKKRLAWDITCQFHDAACADAAQDHFERVVQGRSLPDEMPEYSQDAIIKSSGGSLIRMLVDVGLASSVSDVRRLMAQNAIEVIHPDGNRTTLVLGIGCRNKSWGRNPHRSAPLCADNSIVNYSPLFTSPYPSLWCAFLALTLPVAAD